MIHIFISDVLDILGKSHVLSRQFLFQGGCPAALIAYLYAKLFKPGSVFFIHLVRQNLAGGFFEIPEGLSLLSVYLSLFFTELIDLRIIGAQIVGSVIPILSYVSLLTGLHIKDDLNGIIL